MPANLSDLPEPSVLRLNLLRGLYLLLAVGLGLVIWPWILTHDPVPAHSGPVSQSLLAAIGLLAVAGIRHPLRMLPLLVFEVVWKAIFLISFAVPLWRAGEIDPASWENIWNCLLVIVFIPVIPWRYFFRTFIMSKSEAWR